MSKAGGLAAFLVPWGWSPKSGLSKAGTPRSGELGRGTLALSGEYSYRGISLTERQPGILATIGYELPNRAGQGPSLSRDVGRQRASRAVATELTASARVFYALDRKLSVWLPSRAFQLSRTRRRLSYNYDEFALLRGGLRLRCDAARAARLPTARATTPIRAPPGASRPKDSVPLRTIPLDEGIAPRLLPRSATSTSSAI